MMVFRKVAEPRLNSERGWRAGLRRAILRTFIENIPWVCLGTALLVTAAARADGPVCRGAGSVRTDFARVNCWPEPLNRPDRYAVRAPFLAMVENGWRLQNLLGDQHFDPNTSQLNEAGRLRVSWIMTHAPRPYRVIFVHQTLDLAATQSRIEAVEQYLASAVPSDFQAPPVQPTIAESPGWPADQIDSINRKYNTSMPDPRLPLATAAQPPTQ